MLPGKTEMELPSAPESIRDIPINEALDHFISILRASGASEKTILSYKSAIQDFIEYAEIQTINEISQTKIVSWINHRLRYGFEKKSVPNTRKKRQATMHYYTLFLRKWLVWAGFPKNIVPVVKKPKTPEIEALTEEEVRKLLGASRDLLDVLIISLLFETGLRANELLSLRIEDIDLENNEIIVRDAKYGKERIVFPGPVSKKILEKIVYEKNPQDRLVPLSYNGLYKRLKSLAKRAGLPAEKVRPHILRHTFATEALKKGISLPALQKLLGHTDIKITQVYTHLLKDDLRREYYKAFNKPEIGLEEILPVPEKKTNNRIMGTIFCPFCGKKIPATSRYCPYCGSRIILYSEEMQEA